MERFKVYAVVFALATGISSCNNPGSEPDNESSKMHESMSAAGDAITQHTTGFTTAMHQMPMSGNVDQDCTMVMKSHHK